MGGPIADAFAETLTHRDGRLTEVAAKRVLEEYGIATTLGTVAHTEGSAADLAEQAGFPVVLKVSSPSILHKTDVGGVRLGLGDADAVRSAYQDIVRAIEPVLGQGWEAATPDQGVLVEPMASGFEFLVGSTRSEFGPLVVFGLGGVFAEVLEDVSHGLAPLDDRDARRMLRAIKGRQVFESFRGARAVSETAVADLLTRISRLVVDWPQIAELDLNPVMCSGERVLVADARIVVSEPGSTTDTGGADDTGDTGAHTPAHQEMRSLFAPRSAAVVGATTGRYNRGRAWLRSLRAAGFDGPLYAVSRKDQVDDFPTFQSLSELPEKPDLVMIEVGRGPAQSVLEECSRIGVPWAVVHASGFGEDGTQEGEEASRWLERFVAGGGTRVVGPNALGPYSPASKLVPGVLSSRAGTVGLLSQSGVTFTTVGRMADVRGFGVSHGVSYGSEADVGIDDYLRFLAADDGTDVIACYVEGVQRPAAFARALRNAAARKPVLVVKGGRSAPGARAAQSHSGALTTPSASWEALCAGSGAFLLDDIEALVDNIVAFTYLGELNGLGTGVVTPSGGWGVLFADHCFRTGVGLPELSEDIRDKVGSALPPGTSLRNPIDIGNAYFQLDAVKELLTTMATDPAVDVIAFHLAMDVFSATVRHAAWMEDAYLELLIDAAAAMRPTPLVVVMPHTVEDARRERIALKLLEAGIGVYGDVDRCLAACRNVYVWSTRDQTEAGMTR